jgi:Fur family ferric uptake transcriptional regulator
VLEAFYKNSSSALSNQEIENEIQVSDRVTLYRTLKTFEKSGLIHQAIDGSGTTKYALCHNDCSNHEHLDNHAHFHCVSCEKTTCLEEIETPSVNLPKGFTSQESYLVIKGICETCE